MLNLFFLIQTRRFNINYAVSCLSLLFTFLMGFSRAVLHLTFLLLFFFRGLALTCKALQSMQSDTTSELHVCFKRSYDEVLRHHHSFIIRSVVSVSFLYSQAFDTSYYSFIDLSALIVVTLANLALFFILLSHLILGLGSLPFLPWFLSYLMPDYSINRGPITHLTLSSTGHDQLPALLTDTHK